MNAGHHDEPGSAAAPDLRWLEERLRRDAAAWAGSPSAAFQDRLQARLADLPARATRRRAGARLVLLAAAAAAALAASVLLQRQAGGSGAEGPSAGTPAASFARRWSEIALAPLQEELVALEEDAAQLADAFWQGVPAPLRRVLRS